MIQYYHYTVCPIITFATLESGKKGGTRINYSPEAIKILVRWLEDHIDYPYPTEEERVELCNETGLSRKQLRVWFINTRKVTLLTILSYHLAMLIFGDTAFFNLPLFMLGLLAGSDVLFCQTINELYKEL